LHLPAAIEGTASIRDRNAESGRHRDTSSPRTTGRLLRVEGQVTVLFAFMLTLLLAGGASTLDVGRAYFAQAVALGRLQRR
jgi:hypothetical protein